MAVKNRIEVACVSVLVLLILCTSCTRNLRNQQLAAVAKDWSLVIRASQVIPVYPLSEDLQPGDVLLVSTLIEDQIELYNKKGFLPLDQHLVRLYAKDFHDFYNARYGIDDKDIPPKKWQTLDAQQKHCWNLAPHAAFPTYQFAVKTGSGVNLAIPIQGVPFAMGLMNSGSAAGTVTIAEAYTFGLDNCTLEQQVRDWGLAHRSLLCSYEPQGGKHHFLRVVSRVYCTGRVNVALNNKESTKVNAAAGDDRPVNRMGAPEGGTGENQTARVSAINDLARKQLPGVDVNVATATSRSVTLTERFSRPLVIGYVGFDMPILQGGRLGAPISTLDQLTGRRHLEATSQGSGVQLHRLAALAQMYRALRNTSGEQADRIRAELDELTKLLPERYSFTLCMSAPEPNVQEDDTTVAGTKIQRENFQDVLNYVGNAQTTVEAFQNRPAAQTNPKLSEHLRAARASLEAMNERLYREPAIIAAIDFVFLGY